MAIDNPTCAPLDTVNHAHLPLDAQQTLSVENQSGQPCVAPKDAKTPVIINPRVIRQGEGNAGSEIKLNSPYPPNASQQESGGDGKPLVPRKATPEEDKALQKALDQMLHGDGGLANNPALQQKLSEVANHTLAKDQPPLGLQKGSRSDLPDYFDPVFKYDWNGKPSGEEPVDSKHYPTLTEYNKRVKEGVHEDKDFNDHARDHWNKMDPKEQEQVKKEYEQYERERERVLKSGVYTNEPYIPMGDHLKKYMKDMKQMHDDAHHKAQDQKKQIAKDLGPAFEREQKAWSSAGGHSIDLH